MVTSFAQPRALLPVEDRCRPLADGLFGVAEAVDGGREDGVDVGPEGHPQALDQQAAHVQAVLGHLKADVQNFTNVMNLSNNGP